MLEPTLSLAIALQSDPGVYALLLGSGVSKSAGIPTGWEIVLDLTRKLARLMNEGCVPQPMTTIFINATAVQENLLLFPLGIRPCLTTVGVICRGG
jgi:hypothetical protein